MPARNAAIEKKVKKRRLKKPKVYNPDKYIVAALRNIWRYNPDRKKAKELASDGRGRYKCYVCGELHKEVQIDHKDPVGPCRFPDGSRDYNLLIKRLLYSGIDNLAAICMFCHEIKSSKEKTARAKAKKLAK